MDYVTAAGFCTGPGIPDAGQPRRKAAAVQRQAKAAAHRGSLKPGKCALLLIYLELGIWNVMRSLLSAHPSLTRGPEMDDAKKIRAPFVAHGRCRFAALRSLPSLFHPRGSARRKEPGYKESRPVLQVCGGGS